jgi:hypothetical protein
MAGSTPIYGFPYPESSDLVANYPALGQDLAEDVEAAIAAVPPGGLVHIATESFSAVSSVSLNGVFTSAYDNYKILVSGVSSNSSDVQMRLRVSGTDATGASDYRTQALVGENTTASAFRSSASTWLVGVDSSVRYSISLDLFDVFLTQKTQFISQSPRGNDRAYLLAGFHDLSTSYDGFTLLDNLGTVTGTIRVYGYANS